MTTNHLATFHLKNTCHSIIQKPVLVDFFHLRFFALLSMKFIQLFFLSIISLVIQEKSTRSYIAFFESNAPAELVSEATLASKFSFEPVEDSIDKVLILVNDEVWDYQANGPILTSTVFHNMPNQHFTVILDAYGYFQIGNGNNKWLQVSGKKLIGKHFDPISVTGFLLFEDDGITPLLSGNASGSLNYNQTEDSNGLYDYGMEIGIENPIAMNLMDDVDEFETGRGRPHEKNIQRSEAEDETKSGKYSKGRRSLGGGGYREDDYERKLKDIYHGNGHHRSPHILGIGLHELEHQSINHHSGRNHHDPDIRSFTFM